MKEAEHERKWQSNRSRGKGRKRRPRLFHGASFAGIVMIIIISVFSVILSSSHPASSGFIVVEFSQSEAVAAAVTPGSEQRASDMASVLSPLQEKIIDDAEQVSFHYSISRARHRWCVATNDSGSGNHTYQEGLIFVKIDKCASTTSASVNERIADQLGRRFLPNGKACHHWNSHKFAQELIDGPRNSETSFLWTTVRHPATRGLSRYFFSKVTRREEEASEEGILLFLEKIPRDHMLDYMRLSAGRGKYNVDKVARVMRSYDFVALAERMPESLVVLSMLMEVPLADTIVMSAKKTGSYFAKSSHPLQCVKIHPKWTTQAIDAYLEYNFTKNHYWDYVMHEAASRNLDKTIEALGKAKVQEKLVEFNEMMERNDKLCADEAVFPCPYSGPGHSKRTKKSCYTRDWGCGHDCTRRILKEAADAEWAALSQSGA